MNGKKKVRILVVDDERVVRDFLSRILTLQSVYVKTAEDGFQAIEAVRQEEFDLVFLDIRMPQMNGVEALKELKKVNTNLKFVMMTGYSVDDLLEEAKQEGVVNYLKKPFDINLISTFLKSYTQELPGKKFLKILVVDDDKNVLSFFKALLKGDQYSVTLVNSGTEAENKIREEDFDLVFLDVVLGNENGIEIYSRLKTVKPGIEIMLMTGYPDKAMDAEQTNINGCLFKPFEINKIFSEIDRINDSKKQ